MKGGEGGSLRNNGTDAPKAPDASATSANTNPQVGGGKYRRKGSKHRGKGSKRRGKSSKRRSCKKGGDGIIATAAVPFGLLALQRYFKGSKSSKRGVRKIGSSFKRTFRRRR